MATTAAPPANPKIDRHRVLKGRAVVHSNQRYYDNTDNLEEVLLDLLNYAASERESGHFQQALQKAASRFMTQE